MAKRGIQGGQRKESGQALGTIIFSSLHVFALLLSSLICSSLPFLVSSRSSLLYYLMSHRFFSLRLFSSSSTISHVCSYCLLSLSCSILFSPPLLYPLVCPTLPSSSLIFVPSMSSLPSSCLFYSFVFSHHPCSHLLFPPFQSLALHFLLAICAQAICFYMFLHGPPHWVVTFPPCWRVCR